MTTRDTSFIADGALSGLGSYPVGFYANANGPKPAKPFKIGAQAWGQQAGVCGVTADVGGVALQPWGYAGVVGISNNNPGVTGSSTGNTGVYGIGSPGVRAESFHGIALWAESNDETGVVAKSSDSYGVWANSLHAYGVVGGSGDSSGVVGLAAAQLSSMGSLPTAGVVGIAGIPGPTVPNPSLPNIAGVIGSSDAQPAVIGTSKAHFGVYGFSNDSVGVVGHSANPASFAGYFVGNVIVNGTLALTGMKGAAVPFPDGTRRLLYCMESPELWFEDFGTAKLKRGRVVVKLDADFTKVIKRGDYRVFLTPEGDCRGLYLRRKSAASFEVRELMGGKSAIAFSYRIVGRRKDIKGQRRFAKIDTRLPVPPRARTARPARAKISSPTPAAMRALAARMEKLTAAQTPKRGRAR